MGRDTVTVDRDQLRALADAATPGPWRYVYELIDDLHWGPMGAHVLHRGEHSNYVANRSDSAEAADFAFAAAARSAVPALCDEVDRLRGLLDRCQAALAGLLSWSVLDPSLQPNEELLTQRHYARAVLAELKTTRTASDESEAPPFRS